MRLKELNANNTIILLEQDQTYYAASSVIVGEYPKWVGDEKTGKLVKDKAEEEAYIGKKAKKVEAE